MSVRVFDEKYGVVRNATTHQDVQECLKTIKALHPNWKDDDPALTLKLWHYTLKNYDSQIVKQAVLNVASNMQFTPKLADVINEIKELLGIDALTGYYSKDTSVDIDKETLDLQFEEGLKRTKLRQERYKNKTNRNKTIQESMSEAEKKELDSLVESWRR